MARGRCASTSAPRRASARRSPCSTRGGAGSSGHRRRGRLRRDPRPAETPRAARRPRGGARGGASSTAAPRFEEMDVDAVLARGPTVALVDELAHTNVPGGRNEKRWQDVEELLDAGIDVISTVNIQHLEILNDVVERITGITQRETVPDAVVRRRRPDRAGRHDARSPAAPHGPRQHLRGRARSTPRSATTSVSATSRRCASWRCCGSRTGSTRRSRSTASATASTAMGDARARGGGTHRRAGRRSPDAAGGTHRDPRKGRPRGCSHPRRGRRARTVRGSARRAPRPAGAAGWPLHRGRGC